MKASFDMLGSDPPVSPVVISVPHGGRDYPSTLLAALRCPPKALVALEDRHIDAVARAACGGRTTLIARRGRAWIDLNRGEHERDPQVDWGARTTAQPIAWAKVRSGLGLVPRRTSQTGDLWRRRFSDAEIVQRIVDDHRPYHAALARALAAARARFGVGVLLDLHSMPTLGPGEPRIVIGDRFGRAAAARFVERVEMVAAAEYRVALNTPYAGGHIVDAHGAPSRGVHAIQLEIDRSLYLDPALDRPGAGMPAVATLIAGILGVLEDEAAAHLPALAAE